MLLNIRNTTELLIKSIFQRKEKYKKEGVLPSEKTEKKDETCKVCTDTQLIFNLYRQQLTIIKNW